MSILIKFKRDAIAGYPASNKLGSYEKPTLAQLKNDIITDIFKGVIKNPAFTAIHVDSDGETLITIDSEKDLETALKARPTGQGTFTMIVTEKPAATIVPPTERPTPPQKKLAIGKPLSASAAPFIPPSGSAGTPPGTPSNISENPPTVNADRSLSRSPTPLNGTEKPQGNVQTTRKHKLNARFIQHTAIDDVNTTMYPGVKFLKTWKFKNDGDFPWPKNILLIFVSVKTGDQMGAPDELPVSFEEEIEIGKEADVTVPLIAPRKPGSYTGFWKLASEDGTKFGQRIRAKITVIKLPEENAIMNNEQNLDEKKKHLMYFFPNQARKIDDLVDYFLKGIGPTTATPSLNMVLDGHFKKDDGNRYTMKEIIHYAHIGSSLKENPNLDPWSEALRLLNEPTPSSAAPRSQIIPTAGNVSHVAIPELKARFVEHVTCNGDSTIMYPGIKFFKTWKLRNEGELNWPKTIRLLFVSKQTGDQMGGPEELPVFFPEEIEKDQEIDITVPLIAPAEEGKYKGFWKLADTKGKKFGDRLPVEITVEKLPKESALMNDAQPRDEKKKHLKRLFPNKASDIDNLVDYFLEAIDFNGPTTATPTLDMVLEGHFKKDDGNRYTMDEIIHYAHVGYTMNENRTPYPWTETSTPSSTMNRASRSHIIPTAGNVRTVAIPQLNARFVKDVTCEGESSFMYPGMKFFKIWRFRNDGGLKWPRMVHVAFVSKLEGNQMGGPDELPVYFPEQIEKGKEIDIRVPLIAPAKPGKFKGTWKLLDETKKKFGQQFSVEINVEEFPKKSVLMNDEQTLDEKKTHLKLLFPTRNHQSDNLVDDFLNGIEFEGSTTDTPSLDMVLDGRFTKSNGKRYTMEEIIHFMHVGISVHENRTYYPWAEDSLLPKE